MADGSVGTSPIRFGPRVCAISIIRVSPLSRSAIAIALLLVPRSIARLKRALMRGGLSCLSCCQFASLAARDGKHRLYVIRLGRLRQPADASPLISVPPPPERLP